MSKVNWKDVKNEYIHDETQSYSDLAQKYGVNETTIAVRAGREHWTSLRKTTLAKVQEKTIEKTSETIAKFQAKKLAVGQFMVDKGLKTLQEKDPRNAREAKEVIEVGYKISTEALELDKPQNINNIQVNVQPILGELKAE